MFNVLLIPGYPCNKDCPKRKANCRKSCKEYIDFQPEIVKAYSEYKKKSNYDRVNNDCTFLNAQRNREMKHL